MKIPLKQGLKPASSRLKVSLVKPNEVAEVGPMQNRSENFEQISTPIGVVAFWAIQEEDVQTIALKANTNLYQKRWVLILFFSKYF